ncbi:hypothetical protein TWF173_002056 [Orbilia oligospora]|nr:hypothetical protein TWF173_002056 [Orbilia oligospora]
MQNPELTLWRLNDAIRTFGNVIRSALRLPGHIRIGLRTAIPDVGMRLEVLSDLPLLNLTPFGMLWFGVLAPGMNLSSQMLNTTTSTSPPLHLHITSTSPPPHLHLTSTSSQHHLNLTSTSPPPHLHLTFTSPPSFSIITPSSHIMAASTTTSSS